MRVLMIAAYPLKPGLVNGGVEAAAHTLVHALAGCDEIESITVLCFHQGDAKASRRREGEKVEVLFVPGQKRFRVATRSWLDARHARRVVASIRPDVVHGHELSFNGDIATRCTPNGVVTVHGMVHIEARLAGTRSWRSRLRIWLIDGMVRRILHRARVVVSISSYDSGELASLVGGRQVSIANPVDPQFFAAETPSAGVAPRLLFAGVVRPLKNLIGLVNAFAKVHAEMPESRLSIFGPHPEPEYHARVLARVDELGLTDAVDVAGPVNTARLCHEIAQSRAVVLFSHQEVAPTIIAQAMAARKPVIASRVGGVSDMIEHGATGFVVADGDEEELAARMLTLLRDESLCLQMGRRAHVIARSTYAPAALAQSTIEVYRSLLPTGRNENSA